MKTSIRIARSFEKLPASNRVATFRQATARAVFAILERAQCDDEVDQVLFVIRNPFRLCSDLLIRRPQPEAAANYLVERVMRSVLAAGVLTARRAG